MSILVNGNTRLLVHGICERAGIIYTERMLSAPRQGSFDGTRVVAGVNPGRGGQWVSGVPVFDTAKEAIRATDANAALVCVPSDKVMDAVLEAVDAGLGVVVCTTANVPVRDMIKVNAYLRTVAHAGDRVTAPTISRPVRQRMNTRPRVVLLGPGSPGVFVPDKCVVGAIPPRILKPGGVGVLSRSGSLAYEVTWLLTRSGFGQSTVLGIGDGLIVGTGFADILAMFEDDPLTEQVVLIGEIGGREEEMAAAFIADHMTKPVVAFVVGQTAPPGRRMGHAGAIVEEYEGTAQQKIDALERAGAQIARSLAKIPDLLLSRA